MTDLVKRLRDAARAADRAGRGSNLYLEAADRLEALELEAVGLRYPVGTPVRFYTIAGKTYFNETEIRSTPWRLNSGDIMIKIKCRAGGVHVQHLEVLNAQA